MCGRLSAILVLVPNFLPNGRSHTTASTLALGRGSTARTESRQPRGKVRHESPLQAIFSFIQVYFINKCISYFWSINVFCTNHFTAPTQRSRWLLFVVIAIRLLHYKVTPDQKWYSLYHPHWNLIFLIILEFDLLSRWWCAQMQRLAAPCFFFILLCCYNFVVHLYNENKKDFEAKRHTFNIFPVIIFLHCFLTHRRSFQQMYSVTKLCKFNVLSGLL